MKRFSAFILFAAKCCAVGAATLILLFLLNSRYEQVMSNPYSDTNKFRFMDSTYNNIQICNLGNSHGEYAFNYEKLSKKSGYECFNFAMSSQTYNYDYAILSMYRTHFADDCIMFIPVSYFSFNNEVVNEEEAEFLNAKYYSFLSPRYIPHYSPYVDLVTHRLPILSAGEDIVKILPALSLRAFAAEDTDTAAKNPADTEGTPRNGGPSGTGISAGSGGILQTNAPSKNDGASAHITGVQSSSTPADKEFRQKAKDRYRRHMENKEEYFLPERIGNLYDILDFCKGNGITPVLITTPYTAYYYEQAPAEFKEEFSRVITAIAADKGVPYYDYSEDSRFGNHLEYFSDADHLNEKGAGLFMEIIKQEIPEFRDFLSRNKH